MLQITKSEVIVSSADQFKAFRRKFADDLYVRLTGFIEPGFLGQITDMIRDEEFMERHTPNIGRVETLLNSEIEGEIHQLINQEPLLEAVTQIVGQQVHIWLGNTVRRIPGKDHFSNWHSDMTSPVSCNGCLFRRTVPVSINLSRERFDGGNLEIRDVTDQTILQDIPNKNFGDAIMFQISNNLEHRVADVTGGGPRMVHVGWFHSQIS